MMSDYLSEERKLSISNIEDEILNGGMSGTKRALSFLQSHVDSSNASDGLSNTNNNKKLIAILEQANALFKTIPQRTLNMISSNQTYKNHIKEWNRMHGNKQISNTKKYVADLISHVEEKLNRAILTAKKSDTKRKRQLEKKIVVTFYQTNKDNIKKIFDLQNLLIQAKHIIEKP